MTETPEPASDQEPTSGQGLPAEASSSQPAVDPPDSDTPASDQPVDVYLAAEQEGEGGFARGEALVPRDAGRIAAQSRATVVVLLGGPNSGKTTLLASIYERFGRGRLNGHWFLGSRTLHGFEKRCYRSLHGDGPGGELDGRTAQDAPPWLHIRAARQERPERVFEILLGDFSGEHHSTPIANGSRSATDFPDLRRADHVCITIDGGKMASHGHEAEHRFVVDLARGLLKDPDAIADASAISLVVTKWDLVTQDADGRSAVEELFDELRLVFSDREVGFIETAARSSVEEFPIGFGVGDLLARWTDSPALHILHVPPSGPEVADPFDRFQAAS
jgi:hypothetical protein